MKVVKVQKKRRVRRRLIKGQFSALFFIMFSMIQFVQKYKYILYIIIFYGTSVVKYLLSLSGT